MVLVCWNMFLIFVVLMLMNILMKLFFERLKNGIFVLFVIVLVSRVLFVLGGLMRRIFLGICLFRCWYLFGEWRKFMILWIFLIVLLILVILLKVMFRFFLVYRWFWLCLNCIGELVLFNCWSMKINSKINMFVMRSNILYFF